jgi:phosphonate transport system substrate-binding protein
MKKISPVPVFLLVGVLLAAAGCSKKSNAAPSSAAAGERAGWPDKITIVLMPDEGNPDMGSKNKEFTDALKQFLGIEVEVLESFEYTVGLEAMRSKKLELLLVSPMSYYQAKRIADIEPLVTTGTEGTIPYKTVFITRSDRSDINSVHDLRGKTFAFVDPASSSGYMFPKAKLIKDLGLDTEQIENPGYYFKTVTYSGKHDSSVMGVIMGDYDGAAVALGTIYNLAKAGLIKENDLKILGETEVIPTACFVIRADLPQDLKAKIKEFYLGYDNKEYFELLYKSPDVRYIEAFDADYNVVYEMVELLKIEQ